ncbi:hypothetical protein GCM10023340_08630 [Nocardioides marinquilinus]|uniref:Uncharacterized protein n=1 Tax=Nocardioides marinquilinus TaxID=1210400 RepID=A0ABP9PC48_9ACTN
MGFQLAGWVEFVVEVQWVTDESADFGGFVRGLGDQEPLAMNLTLLQSAVGTQALGAMVDGQSTNTHYVRYAGPAFTVSVAMEYLRDLASRCFPRQT